MTRKERPNSGGNKAAKTWPKLYTGHIYRPLLYYTVQAQVSHPDPHGQSSVHVKKRNDCNTQHCTQNANPHVLLVAAD